MTKENTPFLLWKCIENYLKKNQAGKRGNRFEPDFNQLSMYLFIRGGKNLYEFLVDNLHFPCTKSVRSHLASSNVTPGEGQVNVKGLLEYIEKNNFPKRVAILEDGTAVTKVVEYDAATNSLKGLVSPLNEQTGLPSRNFVASSGLAIAEHIKNFPAAKYVYTILARPAHPRNYFSIYSQFC